MLVFFVSTGSSKLSLDKDKTNYMLFSNKQDEPINTININNIEIISPTNS